MARTSRLFAAVAAATAAVTLGAAPAAAQIVNGGFESPDQGGGYGTVIAPSTTITGWTVSSGAVDHIDSYWQPFEGEQSLDLSGKVAGNIYQDFTLTQAGSYNIFFAMAANPDGGPRTVSMNVSFGLVGGSMSTQTFFFDGSNSTKTNMGWVVKSMLVDASARGSYRLQFTSLENNPYGAALDAVSISAVTATPEPATVALLGTGLLALGGIGLRRRSRR